ncbi:enoyl-CoA hydratase/isomerase family protein [Ferrovibrio sp.]|uniref:enoyl-CoA hydratase/isomerase family protein n=1 Tax=Ferrovibrio sp. TaxID=1917215 RepID=UPI001B457F93|nr:enoyl-CoA hydratase/isomerase family protein [Ferrovibrio sp.]MBP7066039.1 enoyl-CoA hydratase/isomerase family protein [Ferrovibrio sp.]
MLSLERRGRVAVLRFDRSDGRNALSIQAMRELRAAFEALAADAAPPNALVLTGAPTVFSVGFDLKDPSVVNIASASIPERLQGPLAGAAMCKALAGLECYTIVAMEGWCLGGGLALAGSADLLVAGETARLGLPEVDRGMNLSWNALPRLIGRCGPAAAKRLAILGETMDAKTMLALGVLDEVVAAGDALDRALALAEIAAAKPPLAVRMIKRGANAYMEGLIQTASALDAEQFALMTMTEDFAESLAAFRAKRAPNFEGR